MNTIFYMVRHGKTALNEAHRIQGWSDAPLTQAGITEALHAKKVLRYKHIDLAISSTLARAGETLDIIKPHDVPTETYDDLKEYYFGEIDGQIETESLLSITTNDIGFEDVGGESRKSGQQRFWHCLEQIAKTHANQTILLVSHGQILCDFFRKVDPIMRDTTLERWDQVPNGSVTKVVYDGDFHMVERPH